jgi:hypothetical protein
MNMVYQDAALMDEKSNYYDVATSFAKLVGGAGYIPLLVDHHAAVLFVDKMLVKRCPAIGGRNRYRQ